MRFALPVLAMSLGLANTANAEEAAPSEPAPVPAVPFESDEVGGHVQVGISAGYAAPFGKLSKEQAHTDRAGGGGSFGLSLNYGLDRFVTLGAYGQYSLFWDSKNCPDCSAAEWGAGLAVGYHLVQGLRIDPWISYGLGWRSLRAEDGGERTSYGALEWMRLGMGTNWFLTSGVALGPFAQFSAATTVVVPGGETAGATDMRFLFGLRLGLDFPGR